MASHEDYLAGFEDAATVGVREAEVAHRFDLATEDAAGAGGKRGLLEMFQFLQGTGEAGGGIADEPEDGFHPFAGAGVGDRDLGDQPAAGFDLGAVEADRAVGEGRVTQTVAEFIQRGCGEVAVGTDLTLGSSPKVRLNTFRLAPAELMPKIVHSASSPCIPPHQR